MKSQNKNTAKAKNSEGAKEGLQSSQLMKLFENELKDIYWAEKALTKAIPKMIKNATSEELKEALEGHLTVTEKQVVRAEQIFELLNKKPVAKKCEAMVGLIKETEEIMTDCEEGAMRDAGIIAAGQKVEHYEIASYGTLHQFAKTLRLTEIASLLQATLDEEKDADDTLTEIAVNVINFQLVEEEQEV